MRKVRLLLLILALLALFCACQNVAEAEWILEKPEPNSILAAQPETVAYPMETQDTISIMLSGVPGAYPLLDQSEEYTGIHVEFRYVSPQEYSNELTLALSSGDMADMFTGYNRLSVYTFLDYGDEIAYDLAETIQRCAPNYLNYIREHELLAGNVFDGTYGEVFSFYQIKTGDALSNYGPYIRGDWLDALGMDIPQTYDDYHAALVGFKEKFGCKQAFGLQPTGAMSGDYLAAGFDASAFVNGSDMATIGFYIKDGQVVYGPAQEGFWDYVKMLRQWYQEGLFTSDFVTWSDVNGYEKMVMDGKTGLFYSNASRAEGLSRNLQDGYLVPIPDAVKTPGDVLHLGNQDLKMTGSPTFTVFAGSQKADLCVRWCDFWYSELGTQLVNYGTPEKISFEEIDRSKRCTLLPGIYDRRVEQTWTDENVLKAAELWGSGRDNTARIPTDLTMSEKDHDKFALIAQGLSTTVTIWTTQLIVGEYSFDDYEKYQQQLADGGLQKAIDCLNAYLFDTAPVAIKLPENQ